jgi:stress response protein SCP2
VLRVFAPGGTSSATANPSTEMSTLTFGAEGNAQAKELAGALEAASAVLLELPRRAGSWKVPAAGQGYDDLERMASPRTRDL